jgi:TolA-binding protein
MKSGEVRRRREIRQGGVVHARAARIPGDGLAPKALNNAGAVLEKAKKPEEACAACKGSPTSIRAPARRRRVVHGGAHQENVAYYDKAAVFYEQLAQKYPQNPHAADALRSAGVLRQSLGQHDRAIKHYGEYAKRYKDRSDAKSVAFQAAAVREDQKDWRGAAASFAAYSKSYPGDARTVEAHAREADAHLKAGNDAPKDAAAKTLSSFGGGKHGGKATPTAPRTHYWAAQARYRGSSSTATTKLKIAGKPRQLAKVLEERPSGSKPSAIFWTS